MHQEDYRKNIGYRSLGAKSSRYNPELTTIDAHPWRTRREFVKIYEKSSPPKYIDKLPKELASLRASLDMNECHKKVTDYSLAETILPQLKEYELEKPRSKQGK